MEKIISATEIVRDFSTILNRVKFAGDQYIIKRNGKPVARILPIEEKAQIHILKHLKESLEQLPKLDDELDAFSIDLKSISEEQPEIPEDLDWA